MTLHERGLVADSVAVPAPGFTVVDEFVTLGDDRDGLGVDDQLAANVGDLVITRYAFAVGVQNVYRNFVVGGAVPHVGDLGQGQNLGSVTLHQRGLIADSVAVLTVGRSVVCPETVIGQDCNGALFYGQRTVGKGNDVIIQINRCFALRNGYAIPIDGYGGVAHFNLRADQFCREGLAVCQVVNRYG